MSVSTRFPIKLAIGLALTVVADTVIQLTWKVGAVQLADLSFSWTMVEAALRYPTFYIVAGLMLFQLINWLMVLGEADVSFAQPITALSRITVCLASAYFLNERITPEQMAGVLMICAGAWCISHTARKTIGQDSASP